MSELCNCIFFSLSLGGRKEKRIRPRLNETAQSRSTSEAKSKQTMLIILYHSSPATAAALCVLCCLPSHFCLQPPSRLSSAFTPGAPKASSPHSSSTSCHRRHKQLWRQTWLCRVSISELPVLTIPRGAGKAPASPFPSRPVGTVPPVMSSSPLPAGKHCLRVVGRCALCFCLHLIIGFHLVNVHMAPPVPHRAALSPDWGSLEGIMANDNPQILAAIIFCSPPLMSCWYQGEAAP